jgi:hypothetical protein
LATIYNQYADMPMAVAIESAILVGSAWAARALQAQGENGPTRA